MTKNGNRPLIPYLRQSRKKEVTISIEEQKRDITAWAKRTGDKLAPWVIEQGVSGAKHWRKRELGQAIERCGEGGDAGGIIAAYQSRLSRENGLATAEVWAALDEAGTRLVCVYENRDYTPGDDDGEQEFSYGLEALMARREWRRHQRNWDKGVRNAIERGVHVGPAPLGYSVSVVGEDKDGKPISGPLVPSEHAPLVVEAFERKARGASSGDIARFLTASGAKTTHGNEWGRAAVRHLLGNRIYLGELRAKGEHRNIENLKAHPPIVTPSQYRAANRPGKRVAGERSGGRLLGNGLCRCGGCGRCMCYGSTTAKRKDGTTKRYEFLRCINPNCPGGSTVPVAKLEPFLIEQALARYEQVTVLVEVDPALEQAVENAAADLTEVEALHGAVKPAAYAVALSDAQEALDTAEAALADAQVASGDRWVQHDPRGFLAGEVAHIQTARAFLRDVLGSVVVARGKGTIEERATITGGVLAEAAAAA